MSDKVMTSFKKHQIQKNTLTCLTPIHSSCFLQGFVSSLFRLDSINDLLLFDPFASTPAPFGPKLFPDRFECDQEYHQRGAEKQSLD